jgi:DNA-binding response OmpR family regulator
MATTKTVLIIEDETSLRHALADKCKSNGFEVLEAGDGEPGLQMALLKHPDMILLDIILPGRDGMSVLSELRKDAWGSTAKVIILSNVSETEKVAEALEHQVFEYRVKSDVQIERVMESIKTHLGVETATK